MTARELAKLARHIIRTYPEDYQLYGETRIHLEQDPPAQSQSAAGDEYRRRRPQDRLHQGGRLRPGRLGGAERHAADRRRQRHQERKGARRRGQASCSNGASTISSPSRCLPKARPSPMPSSTAASSGSVPLMARPARCGLMVPRDVREQAHRPRGLFRPGAGAGAAGPADRHVEGVARRCPGARGAVAGRRKRRNRQPVRSARSMPPPSS